MTTETGDSAAERLARLQRRSGSRSASAVSSATAAKTAVAGASAVAVLGLMTVFGLREQAPQSSDPVPTAVPASNGSEARPSTPARRVPQAVPVEDVNAVTRVVIPVPEATSSAS